MEVVTPAELSQSYEYAIHGSNLRGQKTYDLQMHCAIEAGKIGDWVAGNKHNLGDFRPRCRIGTVLCNFEPVGRGTISCAGLGIRV